MKKILLALFLVLALTLAAFATAQEVEIDIADEVVEVPVAETDDLLIETDELPDAIDISDELEIDAIDLPAESEAPAMNNEEEEEDPEFSIDRSGVLTEYNGAGGDVTIPDGVTRIGEYAFEGCTSLTSVSIPDGVTSIGWNAFEGCTGLTSISIPNSVTSIGRNAFYKCTGLKSISISNSVTIIEMSAFGGCTGLTSISFPDSVTTIEGYAFSNCTSLASVSFSDSVTTIEGYAFYNCTSLVSISFPDSLTTIGMGAFDVCTSLASVSFPDSLTTIEGIAFFGCTSLTNVTFPDNLSSIGYRAFYSCKALEKIILPAKLKTIGDEAFANCYNLTDVTVENGDADISGNAFAYCPVTLTFHMPCGSSVAKWGEAMGYTVERFNHTPVTDEAVAPTYDKTGLTEGQHCAVCGEIIVAQEEIAKLPKTSLSKAKLTLKYQSHAYTGKALKPAVTVKYGKTKLKKGTDYTVSYANNKDVGTATVTVKGKGKYTGTAKATFKINPKKLAVSKLTAGKKQLTIKWKKQSGITGYEIEYSLNKSFKNSKTIKVKKTKTSATIKKLTGGKKYYVRIRAYSVVKKKTYYSAWSAAKNVKVKK